MNGWKPIETAPRDGTVVDLWADNRRFALGHWDAKWGIWLVMGRVELHAKPTHWMPLPEPPK